MRSTLAYAPVLVSELRPEDDANVMHDVAVLLQLIKQCDYKNVATYIKRDDRLLFSHRQQNNHSSIIDEVDVKIPSAGII